MHTLATQVAGVRLYAVAEVDEQVRVRAANEFGVPHVYAEVHELLALPESDAVVWERQLPGKEEATSGSH